MSATFSTSVRSIRTGSIGNLSNVVKYVEFVVTGTDSGQTFELPAGIEIADPDPAIFIELPSVTEADVIRWIGENYPQMQGLYDHIQRVLNEMIARASFQDTAMPWAPVAQETPGAP